MRHRPQASTDATCARKTRYATLGDAIGGARRVGGSSVRAYRCPTCGRFHIGKPPTWMLKRRFQS